MQRRRSRAERNGPPAFKAPPPPDHTYADDRTYERLAIKPPAEKLIAKIRGKADPVTLHDIL